MIITAAILLSSVMSRPAAFDKYPYYDITTHRFAVTYQPGGRTSQQVKQRISELAPNEEVVSTFNAGYFAPDHNPIVAIDLVVSGGIELSSYRFDLSRPILAFGSKKATIFTGKNGEAYAKLRQYQQAGGYYDAIAGDNKPTKPNVKTSRRIVGIRDHELVVITLSAATWAICKKVIAEQELDQHLYLDGGTSVFNGTKVPTHIIVLTPKDQANG